MGLLVWPYVGLRMAFKHRSVRVRVSSPDHTEILRTHQLMIANGCYVAGPIKASEDATVQDGELTVFSLGGARNGGGFVSVAHLSTHRIAPCRFLKPASSKSKAWASASKPMSITLSCFQVQPLHFVVAELNIEGVH